MQSSAMRHASVKNRDFVILGLENWDDPVGSKNASNISKQIAKDNRVLFVNLPIEIATIIKKPFCPLTKKKVEVLLGAKEDIQQLDKNLWQFYPKAVSKSINWIRNNFIFDLLNRQNSKKLAQKIREAIDILGFKDVILINDNELFRCFYLKEYLKPALYVFYIRDFITHVNYWSRHGRRLEPQILRKADLVIANSTYYTEYSRQFNPNSFFVGQGCNLSLFQPSKIINIPVDMNAIKANGKPVIGYAGALTALRLDLEVLEYLASNKPEWNFVMVGTEDDYFKNSLLHTLDNVFFLGQKRIEDIPAYIYNFDVCINPQDLNRITMGNYPLKIDEYLSMGKPVVATKTRAMELFAGHAYLVNSKEDYIIFIEKALKEDNKKIAQERRKFASSHTWEESVNNIYRAIVETETNNMLQGRF